MADPEEQIRAQLRDAFEGANYPVNNQMDLIPALPNGPGTKFEADGVSFTAMELAAKLGGHQDFPYADVDALVDDVIEGLKAEGML
ncbi:MAG: MTH865 family protein [Salinigranum sp.]